jgi:hypothetical protein
MKQWKECANWIFEEVHRILDRRFAELKGKIYL